MGDHCSEVARYASRPLVKSCAAEVGPTRIDPALAAMCDHSQAHSEKSLAYSGTWAHTPFNFLFAIVISCG